MRPGDALLLFADAVENDLGRALERASAAANRELFARLTALGHAVRPAIMPVFMGLDPAGTHITVLAARAGISRQAMSALVRDVEAAGLVATSQDPGDKRALLVELTETGAAMCRDAAELSHAITAEWQAKLGEKQFSALLETTRAIGNDPS